MQQNQSFIITSIFESEIKIARKNIERALKKNEDITLTSMPPEQFIIFLCQPKRTIKKILVSRKATVKELSLLFPTEKKCFIFKGMMLHESMKLESYGISNLDHIVVVPEEQSKQPLFNKEQMVWMNATRDQQDFNDRMFLSTNCSTRIEAARLKDLKMTKLELKRKSFNKMIVKMEEETEEATTTPKLRATKLDKAECPSCEPLPVFWASPKRKTFKILRGSSDPELTVDQPINV